MTQINPYNFLELRKEEPDRSSGHSGFYRYSEGWLSGRLVCTLAALTDLVTLGKMADSNYGLVDENNNPVLDKQKKQIKIKVFHFCCNSANKAIIRGTTLKGMVRAVYEALADACMPLTVTRGEYNKPQKKEPGKEKEKHEYVYQPLGKYDHSQCSKITALCPACRVFGTLSEDQEACKGRLTFSDAKLISGELIQERRFVKILAGPKPHHQATYGKSLTQGGPIAGRKFYYHHAPGTTWTIDQKRSNKGGIAIEEYAPKGSIFEFNIIFDNLRIKELGRLITALLLEEGLAHKVGLGKAIGLGSCRIKINENKSQIFKGVKRYQRYAQDHSEDQDLHDNLSRFGCPTESIPGSLEEVLRENKPSDGSIGYPSFSDYKNNNTFKAPIDALGVFNGKTTQPGRAFKYGTVESRRSEKETWTNATLVWTKGNKTLTANACGKTATALGKLKIPEHYWNKLNTPKKKKRKSVTADVEVEKEGNAYKILAIDGDSITF